MTGLDTNVLVRFLVRDDAAQAKAAERFLREQCTTEEPGWVNRIVLCELVWVLDRAYGYSREHIAGVLERLLRTRQLAVEGFPHAWKALSAYRDAKGDFADSLLASTNREAGCGHTVTLDRHAARLEGMVLLTP